MGAIVAPVFAPGETPTPARLNAIFSTLFSALQGIDQHNLQAGSNIDVNRVVGAISTTGGTINGNLFLTGYLSGIDVDFLLDMVTSSASLATQFVKQDYTFTVSVDNGTDKYLIAQTNGVTIEGGTIIINAPTGYSGIDAIPLWSFRGVSIPDNGNLNPGEHFYWDIPVKSSSDIRITAQSKYVGIAPYDESYILYWDLTVLFFRKGLQL